MIRPVLCWRLSTYQITYHWFWCSRLLLNSATKLFDFYWIPKKCWNTNEPTTKPTQPAKRQSYKINIIHCRIEYPTEISHKDSTDFTVERCNSSDIANNCTIGCTEFCQFGTKLGCLPKLLFFILMSHKFLFVNHRFEISLVDFNYCNYNICLRHTQYSIFVVILRIIINNVFQLKKVLMGFSQN